jgi:hypothetical protein
MPVPRRSGRFGCVPPDGGFSAAEYPSATQRIPLSGQDSLNRPHEPEDGDQRRRGLQLGVQLGVLELALGGVEAA